MTEQPINHRALRAAAETVRSKLRIAKAGPFFTALCFFLGYQFDHGQYSGVAPDWIPTALYVAGPLIAAALLIPALRVACPKCKGRYCQFSTIYRRASNPPPCACCGFDVEGHIPRYG
ncbi:hypothetical protein [Dyella mobilis]|uniref:Uncharacterized protein n=1 Tax=Dyella mobilis TaxID=1849582 RepID=A0ABS2KEJ4_9GAMM|nr:hypothetical protein [Dyella mobilis]MBM7129280.1 hypothetical protein [Dyella mobilis]GLQ98572.1 hypothetical protein GCM10007863_29920 [Dyella mobilis]